MTTKPKTPKTRKPPADAPKLSPPVAEAIARHKAAIAAREAAADDNDDEIFSSLCDAEDDALNELAKTPCASDAEFVEKLRYVLKYELWMFDNTEGSTFH